MLSKVVIYSLLILSMLSCSVKQNIDRVYVDIIGDKLNIGHEISCFQLHFASDSLVVLSSFSNKNKLTAYQFKDGRYQELDFLRVGNGPNEVLDAKIKYHSDTIFVMSTAPSGISGFLSIPLSSFNNEETWDNIDAPKSCLLGADFAIIDRNEFIILAEDFNISNILTSYNVSLSQYSSMGYWPNDNYDDSIIAKQLIYMRASSIFAKNSNVLFASGDGCLASLIDFSSVPYQETLLYSDYPQYKLSEDGLNPSRFSNSSLGMYSFATDSAIFLSPIKCKLRNGNYVPVAYKGYPPYYTDEIDVFDWDGNYRYTYRTDVPLGSFFVNEREQKLYILTQNIDDLTSEIYVYDL